MDADGHSDYVDGADGADDVVDAVDDVVDDSVDDDDVGIMAVATKNAAATGKKQTITMTLIRTSLIRYTKLFQNNL